MATDTFIEINNKMKNLNNRKMASTNGGGVHRSLIKKHVANYFEEIKNRLNPRLIQFIPME